jgi:hypothetical protein
VNLRNFFAEVSGANVYKVAGAYSLQQLETGLRAPVRSPALGYGSLKLLPSWDTLRGDPRFDKMVASLAPKDEGSK